MKIVLRNGWLILIVLSLHAQNAVTAQDAVFDKSTLFAPGGRPTPVTLVVSDAGLTIRSKDKTSPLILDLPYSGIQNIGYSYLDQRRLSLMPLIGITALFIKGKSHWLIIQSSDVSSGKDTTVLRLNAAEYAGVVAALTAKSGKPVELLAPGSTLLDPTYGSHDEDETIPFSVDQTIAALKPAMAQYSCKAGGFKKNRIECKRGLRPRDGIGGGEMVTAFLESQGAETRVQIKTQKGLGKNWSLPIFREMLQVLQAPRAGSI